MSDLPPKVGDENTELSSVYEKTIFFDIKFKAINPKLSKGKIIVKLHIDFEVQNDYKPSNPKYPVIKREIYYLARGISEQLGTITENTNYDKLEKVYSIWVCNDRIAKNLTNTISSYKIVRKDMLGTCDEPEAEFDLMEAIIIRRGDKALEGNDLFQYLEGVFTADLDKIKKYVDIPEGSKVESEVKKMSGLAAEVFDKGVDTALELMSWLFSSQRTDDAKRATEDAEYRDELFKEYNEVMKNRTS